MAERGVIKHVSAIHRKPRKERRKREVTPFPQQDRANDKRSGQVGEDAHDQADSYVPIGELVEVGAKDQERQPYGKREELPRPHDFHILITYDSIGSIDASTSAGNWPIGLPVSVLF